MRRSTLVMCALLVTATFGCDRVRPQVASWSATLKQKYEQIRDRILRRKPAPVNQAPAPAPESTAVTPAAPASAPPAKPGARKPTAQTPAPPPPPPSGGVTPPRDVPYVSNDTGTIAPGMAERDVYSLWGAPVAVRHIGEFTYLYFPNGCEHTCGIMDVVTLQSGQVVNAVLRWPGHNYSGQSTSPASTLPHGPPKQAPLQTSNP